MDIEREFQELKFKVVLFEKKEQRKPANLYDLHIYSNIFGYREEFVESLKTQREEVGFVDGFVLTNVLSYYDCEKIMRLSDRLGFEYDIPTSGEIDERAKSCNWVIDCIWSGNIFKRICEHLNVERCKGGVLQMATGINSRCRVYKYNAGNVYRPHVDGAWAGSGIDDQQRYVYDHHPDQWSKYTCIIYLNDDFQGGNTVFFTPAQSKGTLNANGVKPKQGSALCFRHGDQSNSLVHEGSTLIQGTKYIMRTDILYPK